MKKNCFVFSDHNIPESSMPSSYRQVDEKSVKKNEDTFIAIL